MNSTKVRDRLLNRNYEDYRSSSWMQTPISFICWQLRKLKKFDNSFAYEKNSALFKILNFDNPINLEFFTKFDISLVEIKKIMVALNAKDQLKNFGAEALYRILYSLKDNLSDGKYIKSIYSEIKNALSELDKEKKIKNIPDDIYYYVKRGKEQFYSPNTDTYYFNDKILPRVIMNLNRLH